MLLVTYDIENDKKRTKFSTFLKKFGRRLQYSVFELKNSNRILQNVLKEVELKYEPKFTGVDNILIVPLCEGCKKKIRRYGSGAHEEEEVVLF